MAALALLAGGAGAAYVLAPAEAVASATADDIDLAALDRVPEGTWAALRTKRIYFGHQSVGGNVIDGVREILRRKPAIGLRVADAREGDAFASPGLIHGPVGANENVPLKLKEFADAVAAHGASLDMAMMKFCYADLRADAPTGALALLASYARTVGEIEKANPKLRMVHCTIPLTALQVGPKARIKALLGRDNGGDNIPRQEYNVGLLKAFGESAVFDIALSESRGLGDSPASLLRDGVAYPCLHRAFTEDGGHLNAGGRVAVARDFLLFLAAQCGPTD